MARLMPIGTRRRSERCGAERAYKVAMHETTIKPIARIALGSMLMFTGVGHLTFARKDFQAQVPDWVPLPKDTTVLCSGIAEIALGSTLIITDEAHQSVVGTVAAAFFVAVFPGNISQYRNRRNAFGLDTDRKRFVRLFFQPVLVYWALKSTASNHHTSL